ncbi:MAG: hypothetical protein NW241_21445 [Bacteroidia bacterium]|nr:hypothetical protein [Bacteroidia bacterium]
MRSLSLLLIPACLWLSACEKGNVDLDNAGSMTLQVMVDELAYDMPPRSYARIKLAEGPHKLIVKDSSGRVLEEAAFRVAKGGLINVSKANYYIWADLYGDAALRPSYLKEDWLEIGKQSFFGDFELLDPGLLYVEQKWDFGLSEDFPEDLLGWNVQKDKYLVRRKLFREPDLIQAYYNAARQGDPAAAPPPAKP